MSAIRTPTSPWVAREGKVYFATAVGVSTASTLSGVFSEDAASGSAQIESAIKNVTVTPPDTGYDKQDFIGVDTNNFQNSLLDEKPVGMATFTGTLILGNDETIEDKVMSGTVTSPAGYTRYQVGKTHDNVVNVCLALNKNDYSDSVTYALFNARVTKWGDIRLGSPDTHVEQDVTVVCLAKDFYTEFKD